MAVVSGNDVPGTEHKNGEIWSSALREIFMTIGKRMTDTIVLEGTFGMPIGPTYAQFAQKLLTADRALTGGVNAQVICKAMTSRGILASSDCFATPRGEVTWFQSIDRGVSGTSITSTLTIADRRVIDRLIVNTSIVGDAQIALTGPDGTSAKLGSLDAFRGRSAAGRWTLSVTAAQTVTLTSWSLAIQFAGDQPLAVRPKAAGEEQFIAAVA